MHKQSIRTFTFKGKKEYMILKSLSYICEFLSDFLRMDSEESSLKSRSIVETSEALIARPRPRAANT